MALLERKRAGGASTEGVRHPRVILGVGDNDDVFKVFGSSTEERNAADVDVLDVLIRIEIVQVASHEVDGFDPVSKQFSGMW